MELACLNPLFPLLNNINYNGDFNIVQLHTGELLIQQRVSKKQHKNDWKKEHNFRDTFSDFSQSFEPWHSKHFGHIFSKHFFGCIYTKDLHRNKRKIVLW